MANQGGGNNNPRGDNQHRNPGGNTGAPPAGVRRIGQVARVTTVSSSSDTRRQARQRARTNRREDAARQRAVQRQQQAQPNTPPPTQGGKLKAALKAVHKHSMYSDKSLTGKNQRNKKSTSSLIVELANQARRRMS